MTHLSENSRPLSIRHTEVRRREVLTEALSGFNQVGMILLPCGENQGISGLNAIMGDIGHYLGSEATLIIVGEPADLVHVHHALSGLNYQLWIAIKRQTLRFHPDNARLPAHHFGALVYTRYKGPLQHCVTRIQYSYCPACNKTTKDYGGKKHTYNAYGTLLSDIWRDIPCDPQADLDPVIQRFADLFGLEKYQELRVLDCRGLGRTAQSQIAENSPASYNTQLCLGENSHPRTGNAGRLIQGDCLESLKAIGDDSVDFAFVDPPYNLGKNYNNYADDLSIQEYFSWCDQWIDELGRVLRPGRTLAILNIPLWAIRHFLHTETALEFQNWIAWEALSFPVRKIMPAHYAVLCFSKGQPRPLPGLTGGSGSFELPNSSKTFVPLEPMAEWYCLRASCVKKRNIHQVTDRGILSDLWWDIHRLKHNSRRVDHPCQLPPQLMYRLISVFTEAGETVLDCFDGSGTTTLAAHQLGRRYLGIELSEKYHQIARGRHEEIEQGLDPFRKAKRTLTEKNSRVRRMSEQRYVIPKKTLQLDVRRVARLLSRLPSRQEMARHGKYPIQYYDQYFASWGEACAAARHEGMSETRPDDLENTDKTTHQMTLFDTD